MNENLKGPFTDWLFKDLDYKSQPTPRQVDIYRVWFERGYNESLAQIRRLEDEVKRLKGE